MALICRKCLCRLTKVIVGSVVHVAELNWKWMFFFLRETFCGLEYPENAFAAGTLLRTPLGELTMLPILPSRLGKGHPSPDRTQVGAFGASTLGSSPVDIISGYATKHRCKYFRPKIRLLRDQRSVAGLCVHDHKSLCAAVTICAILVSIQTHRHTDSILTNLYG